LVTTNWVGEVSKKSDSKVAIEGLRQQSKAKRCRKNEIREQNPREKGAT